jgi:hypothetical protein
MKCEKGDTVDECELRLLRDAVDEAERAEGRKKIHDPRVKQIIGIVEKFLEDRKRICYGGTAINNILPPEEQFYEKDVEFPDYDFFSPEPVKDAKDLADIYVAHGLRNVEAKAGVHAGTFKVFVEFLPVADITFLPPELYRALAKGAIVVKGIHYAPPNYLRMAMYLELSRPRGDVGRWEKVTKRLALLNNSYPLRGIGCDDITTTSLFEPSATTPHGLHSEVFQIARDTLINQHVVFFGALAARRYLRHLRRFKGKPLPKVPDFDVLATDPAAVAEILKAQLKAAGIKNVRVKSRPGAGEIVPPHHEVAVGKDPVAFIYAPLACHSYNVVTIKGRKIRVATVDTMLSFYLAFIYVRRPYYDPQRILCLAHYLYKVQRKNRLGGKGELRRFGSTCYGAEKHTLANMRGEKAKIFRTLKGKRGSKEWEWFFLNYAPQVASSKSDRSNKAKTTRKKARGKRKRKRRTRRTGLLGRLKP